MAHAEGVLKKPVSWKLSLAAVVGVIVALIVVYFVSHYSRGDSRKTINAVSKSEVTERTETGAKSQQFLSAETAVEKTYEFSDSVNQILVPLGPRWSDWIKTPPRSTWRITPPDSGWAEVWYWDGTRSKIYPDKHVWRGVKCGIFRLRGEGGEAAVTIDRN